MMTRSISFARLPIVGSLIGVFDDLTNALAHFKSRKEAASMFSSRLDRVALILTGDKAQ